MSRVESVCRAKWVRSNSNRDRQRLYLLAIFFWSVRVDFIVFTFVLVLYDVVRRRPFRVVLKASLVGAGLYCLATLAPVVMVSRWVAPEQAARDVGLGSFLAG